MVNRAVLAALSASLLLSGGFEVAAQTVEVACENTLKDLQEAEATATLSPDDAKQVAALETKGTDMCNSDDDKGANEIFAEAMKIINKQ